MRGNDRISELCWPIISSLCGLVRGGEGVQERGVEGGNGEERDIGRMG